MKLNISSIFSPRKVHATTNTQDSKMSRFPLPDYFIKASLGRSMNMLTFEDLRTFARNPHPNLPLIIVQDENGRILKHDDMPTRTPRGRQPIALADITYKDARQTSRAAKTHHHPYPHSGNVPNESCGGNPKQKTKSRTKTTDKSSSSSSSSSSSCSSPPQKSIFSQLKVKYNFDDVGGAVPQMAAEREARSNIATRKALKNQRVVAAIFAEEIKEVSKCTALAPAPAPARKASGDGDIQFGWT